MKYIITESKLFNAIYQYLDSYLDSNEIDWVYGRDEGEDGYNGADLENENFFIFYKGNWEGEDFTDIIFNYFDIEYYSDAPSAKPHKDKAPTLEVMGEYGEHLDNMFNEHWEEPMKKWFENKFNLPVKSVTTYYE